MKFLLLIAIVLLVAWLWRGNREEDGRERSASAGRTRAAPPQQEMIQCPVCSVHLPRADALPGPDGRLYCCAEHRLLAGR